MLSIQLVITMVFASIFSKLVPAYSLARKLLASSGKQSWHQAIKQHICMFLYLGLVRYLPPEDDELRTLANLPPPKPPQANNGHQSNKNKR